MARGRKPMSKEQRSAVISLITGGDYRLEDVADQCGVSLRTVKTIKKEIPVSQLQASQESERTFARYTKSELKYIKKIKAEQDLFEDVEEGWIYHVTAEFAKKQGASRWWMGIAYPESVDENWIEKLRFIGIEIAISPLHDKDVWGHDSPPETDPETGEVIGEAGTRYKQGDKKKEHWHFVLKFPVASGFREVNEQIREITHGPYLQKCRSLKGAYEYFVHLNHPEKYQYDKDEIQKYNNFVIEPTKSDQIYMLQDILREIRTNEFDTMTAVTAFYDLLPEYLLVVSNKAYVIGKLLDENWRKHNPDHAKRVQIVGGNSNGKK